MQDLITELCVGTAGYPWCVTRQQPVCLHAPRAATQESPPSRSKPPTAKTARHEAGLLLWYVALRNTICECQKRLIRREGFPKILNPPGLTPHQVNAKTPDNLENSGNIQWPLQLQVHSAWEYPYSSHMPHTCLALHFAGHFSFHPEVFGGRYPQQAPYYFLFLKYSLRSTLESMFVPSLPHNCSVILWLCFGPVVSGLAPPPHLKV